MNLYPDGADPGEPASIEDEEVHRADTYEKII